MAVGMAMAARYERGLLDPDAPPRAPAPSTTASGSSPATATSRRASRPRPRPSPASRGCIASASSTTTTTSPSRATRRRLRARTSASATRPTAGPRTRSRRPRTAPSTSLRCTRRSRAATVGDRSADAHPAAHDDRLARAARAQHREGARIGARRGRDPGHQGDPRPRPRASTSPSTPTCWPGSASDCAIGSTRPAPRGTRTSPAWRAAHPDGAALLDRLLAHELPDGPRRRPPDLSGRRVRRDPQGLRRGHQRHRRGHARAVGRLGRPGRVEQHDHRGRRQLPARRRARCRTPRPTAGCCTSASASTRWAPSSTASPSTGSPGRSAARSWSSPTTCAAPSACPR